MRYNCQIRKWGEIRVPIPTLPWSSYLGPINTSPFTHLIGLLGELRESQNAWNPELLEETAKFLKNGYYCHEILIAVPSHEFPQKKNTCLCLRTRIPTKNGLFLSRLWKQEDIWITTSQYLSSIYRHIKPKPFQKWHQINHISLLFTPSDYPHLNFIFSKICSKREVYLPIQVSLTVVDFSIHCPYQRPMTQSKQLTKMQKDDFLISSFWKSTLEKFRLPCLAEKETLVSQAFTVAVLLRPMGWAVLLFSELIN